AGPRRRTPRPGPAARRRTATGRRRRRGRRSGRVRGPRFRLHGEDQVVGGGAEVAGVGGGPRGEAEGVAGLEEGERPPPQFLGGAGLPQVAGRLGGGRRRGRQLQPAASYLGKA